MSPRCRECGDVKPLNRAGVCRYRGGCEHRQFVHEQRMARLNAALDASWPRDPGGVIRTPVVLSEALLDALRRRWEGR